MLKYRALLKGTNFFLNSGGKVCRHGFFTTRFAEADTTEEAEEIAVQLIRDDRVLKAAVLNDVAAPPTIYLKEIDELASFDGVVPPREGYPFHPEDGGEEQ